MKNYTDITIILDKSGSMQSVKDDTIGGFNSFVEEQKRMKTNGCISLVQFNEKHEVTFKGNDISYCPSLNPSNYMPNGSTALLDAVGKTIIDMGIRLQSMPEHERPDKVIVVIMTDGHENASKEFKKTQINQMISHQREKYNWQFVFLGANQDAIQEGSSLGVALGNSLTYFANTKGTQNAFRSLSQNVASYSSGATMDCHFTSADIKAQADSK